MPTSSQGLLKLLYLQTPLLLPLRASNQLDKCVTPYTTSFKHSRNFSYSQKCKQYPY